MLNIFYKKNYRKESFFGKKSSFQTFLQKTFNFFCPCLFGFALLSTWCVAQDTANWALILAPMEAEKMEVVVAEPLEAKPLEGHAAKYFLSEEELLGKISENLKEKFRLDGRVEVRFLRSIHIPALPNRDWNIKVVDIPAIVSSRMSISFKILCKEEIVMAVSKIPVQCEIHKNVWMSQTALSANTVLSEKDFYTTTIDVLAIKDTPIPDHTALEKFALKRALRSNELLTFAHVEALPLVRKGQTLEVVAEKGLLTIKLKAIALENGTLGQSVSVKNIDSQKVFQGRILNENTVQINF